MNLINALNEIAKSTYLLEDEGKYLEERALIKQLGYIIDSDLNKPFMNEKNEYTPLDERKKEEWSNKLWLTIKNELFNIIPDPQMAVDFEKRFEEEKSGKSIDRLADLQTSLVTYFTESLKTKYSNGEVNLDDVNYLFSEYENYIIRPNSAWLNDPSKNVGLDKSIEFLNIKKDDLIRVINDFYVK